MSRKFACRFSPELLCATSAGMYSGSGLTEPVSPRKVVVSCITACRRDWLSVGSSSTCLSAPDRDVAGRERHRRIVPEAQRFFAGRTVAADARRVWAQALEQRHERKEVGARGVREQRLGQLQRIGRFPFLGGHVNSVALGCRYQRELVERVDRYLRREQAVERAAERERVARAGELRLVDLDARAQAAQHDLVGDAARRRRCRRCGSRSRAVRWRGLAVCSCCGSCTARPGS